MATLNRAKRSGRSRNERGIALIWTVICLVTLLALGGFAVDLGNWYLTIQRMQRAADAGALAGAVYLPERPDQAVAAARAALAANGYTDQDEILEVAQIPDRPNRIRIRLTRTVNNSFIGLIGNAFAKQKLQRTAIGQFSGAVQMGSPMNALGKEPDGLGPKWETSPGSQADFWLAIGGGGNFKGDGDRWQSSACVRPPGANVQVGDDTTDNCNGVNTDLKPNGQEYVVRVPDNKVGSLEIQLWDAGFVETDADCDSTNMDSAANLEKPGDPPNLYDRGPANPYCAGEVITGLDKTLGTSTTYTLWSPTDNGVPSSPVPGCSKRFEGYSGDVGALLTAPPPGFQLTADAWRRWTSLCTLPIGGANTTGDYILRVTTDAGDRGMNTFSIRAGLVSGPGAINVNASRGINVFANGQFTLNASKIGADTRFYLTRVHSGLAGQDMIINLFDAGDAAAGGTEISVLPPPGAEDNGAPLNAFTGCTQIGPDGTNPNPAGDPKTSLPDCTIPNATRDNYNGEIVGIRLPIPSGYTCDDADPMACWVRLRINYGGGEVRDTTSWEIKLPGRPVRLVNPK